MASTRVSADPPASGLLAIALSLLLFGCGRSTSPPEAPATEATASRQEDERQPFVAVDGPSFRYYHGGTGHYYFPEVMGGGVAWVDLDQDGDLDLVLAQGRRLEPMASDEGWMEPPASPGARFLANEGDWRYRDRTERIGLEELAYGMGVAVGDVDGDGTADLYFANWGPDSLWLNRGDGRLERASLEGDDGWSAGATFFDYDRDGDLDLYLVRYVSYRIGDASCRTAAGGPDYCGPLRYPGVPDRLLRNRGDGTFDDVSTAAGIDGVASRGMSAVAADLDGDGWTDLFVSSDSTANHLWRNRGDGTFEDRALDSGCALNFLGSPEASMGIALGDLDGDGSPDLLVTHLFAETNTLYLNDGRGLFRDASMVSGLGTPSLDFTTFGVGLFDADHDGFQDLAMTSGLVRLPPSSPVGGNGDPYPLAQRAQFFFGREGNRFEEAASADSPWQVPGVGRGLAVGDADGDGDLDVVAVNSSGPLRLLRNEHRSEGDWIALRAAPGASDALVGARVRLKVAGPATPTRFVHRDGSYASSSEPVAHFGLGETAAPVDLEIREPLGRSIRLVALSPARSYRLPRLP